MPRDSVLLSCVLFSIALLSLVRAALWNALALRDEAALEKLDAGFRAEAQTASYLGIASLAIIVIGLIILWTGYIKRSRAAWLVMFVVAWGWAFPLFVLPLFRGRIVLTFSEGFYDAIYQPGSGRLLPESALIFLLMVTALLLPIRPFFSKESYRPNEGLLPKVIRGPAPAGVLLGAAFLVWIHLQVYDIPPEALNSWQRLPPPPPPPPPCEAQRSVKVD